MGFGVFANHPTVHGVGVTKGRVGGCGCLRKWQVKSDIFNLPIFIYIYFWNFYGIGANNRTGLKRFGVSNMQGFLKTQLSILTLITNQEGSLRVKDILTKIR